ncbi:iron-containing redox enzyme family protein [Streptomyces sp. MST-110588]|uniref:iron-containing redox enzyme family protein n=1 Tax=Streptomyces sp. MST-110588 TaxID=2833628 RepID=UPI001F5D3550|nr:iron-containing redox enzyme family protein [Streptomyces sp. MST-110588]UNO38850.1 iron-containing redox enzyme family protein [Streptomyces sp. MST-110588]
MKLPSARGEISAAVVSVLGRSPGEGRPALPDESAVAACDPYGDDLQLALYVCYELHYRGFHGVDDAWEWDPDLLRLRAALERRFLEALRADVPAPAGADEALSGLLTEPVDGAGVSHHLRDQGQLWQAREYAAQRSLYHLKEADPQLWVIPRLTGRAKAGMAAVEYDEFGAGRAERVHSKLFADLMEDLGLDSTYGRYLDAGSRQMLAVVNLMSLFGLHRARRGALVGHFAWVEITSSPGSRRLAQALERLGAGPAAVHFYAEHVEADAVHEQLVRHEVVEGLLREEPELDADVAFGVAATDWLEDRLADHLLDAWKADRPSVRVAL